MSSLPTKATNDADLLASSRAGGIEAFGELVGRYQNLVCAVAYSNTGDRLLSEDIGQETFLTAWKKLDTVREPDKLRSWLCSIARNLSSKALRGRKREVLSGAETIDRNAGVDPGPLAAAISKEREATVWQALEDLPESYREPLVLFYREDKSIKQVALGLGLSEDTAKQRLSRGRQALKEGMSHLVEQTLESSRPSKVFTAAVLASVAGAAAPGSAAASNANTANSGAASSAATGAKLLWIGLSVGLLLALVVGFVVTRSTDSEAPSQGNTQVGDSTSNQDVLAVLHEKRKVAISPTAGISCKFRGSVLDSAGFAIPGALVAVVMDSRQSGVLDPDSVPIAADGTWQSGSLSEGTYLISISAPGHLAETRTVHCDSSSSGSKSLDVPLTIGGTRLHGTVSDIGGGPVGGVTIWLLPTLGQAGAAITAKTDSDGRYDLSVHPDRYMMLIHHPDYVLDARPVLVAGESTEEDFVSLPGAVVEGTVVDGTGAPVASAKVSTGGVSFRNVRRPEWFFASLFGVMFPVESDAQGRYRLAGLPPGVAQIQARTANQVTRDPTSAELAIAETETGVQVTVAEAFKVTGFVVQKDNPHTGMPKVNVIVQQDGTLATPNFATSDASGYFEIAGVVPGKYRIISVGETVAPFVTNETIEVVDADVIDVLVRAEMGAALVGKISPPGRAAVRLEPASYEKDDSGVAALAMAAMTRVEVDASGGFRFPAVADGEYVIVANTIDGEGRTPVTVAGGEISGLSVNIETFGGLRGRVLDDSGKPVSGALVAARAQHSSKSNARTAQMHTQDRTNSDGQFEIIGLYPATYDVRVFDRSGQRAWASAKSDKPFEPRTVEVSEGTVTMDLSIASKGKTVRGVVIGLEGAPVQDAWVEVRAKTSDNAPVFYKPIPRLTDSAGRFEVDGLFGNEFEVEATGPRGKLQAASVKTAGGDESVTLSLAALSKVLATVKYNGELVQDFEVNVSGGPTTVYGRMVEKKNGSFELPRLISGEYTIEVKAEESYVQQLVSVGPDPTTAIEFQLKPTSSVHGRVVDESGSPLAGARLTLFGVSLRANGPINPAGMEVEVNGSFEVGALAAGHGTILVQGSADEYDPIAFLEFDLKPGQNLDLGTIKRGKRQSLADAPYADTSKDLGIRFFAGPQRPTAAQLQQIDESDDPRSLLETEGAQLWIATVMAGSAAEQAGLRRGDSVLAVGQMQIGDDLPPSEAMISLSQRWRSKGRTVDWVVERQGRQLTVPVLVAKE